MVLLEGVRSAEPRTSSGIDRRDRLERHLARLAGRDASAARRRASPSGPRSPRPSAAGRLAVHAARRTRPAGRRPAPRSARVQAVARRRAAAAGLRARPPGCRPAPRRARASSRCAALAPASSSAPSGSPCALDVPAFFGAPKPMMVLQAIRRRPVGRLRARRAPPRWPRDRGRRCARPRQPAASKRFSWSTRIGQRQRPVDRDAVVVEQDDQPGQLQVARRARSPPG